jgi:multimeric flavodoxin WrbA
MLVMIDATAVSGGPLARALDTAGRSAAACGADVRTVRLYEMCGHVCARCMACAGGGRRCSSRSPDLTALVDLVRSADAVLVGAPSRMLGGDPAARALLTRLMRAFAQVPDARHGVPVRHVEACKLAAVIASCSAPSMVPASVGQMMGTAGTAWRTLTTCGVDVVGTAALLGASSSPGALDAPLDRAERLGRMLAAAPRAGANAGAPAVVARPSGVRPSSMPRPLRDTAPAHLARPIGV